jgi:hypothetical protein
MENLYRVRFEDIGGGQVDVAFQPSDYLLGLSYEDKIYALTSCLELLKSDLENYDDPYYMSRFDFDAGGELETPTKTNLELQIKIAESIIDEFQKDGLNS